MPKGNGWAWCRGAGERQTAGRCSVSTYATPNGTRKFRYSDYLKVGPPEGGSRVFQTLTKLAESGGQWSETAEQFHYQFHAQGRLLEAAFAQTPQSGQTGYSAESPAGPLLKP